MPRLGIFNETKKPLPKKAAFDAVKNIVLGRKYDLALVFTGPSQIRKLNLIYRNKAKTADILSFPLSRNEGQIFICPGEAAKEAKKSGRSEKNFLLFLFIHGCVHLKGYDHGATMEGIENKLRRKFGV